MKGTVLNTWMITALSLCIGQQRKGLVALAADRQVTPTWGGRGCLCELLRQVDCLGAGFAVVAESHEDGAEVTLACGGKDIHGRRWLCLVL